MALLAEELVQEWLNRQGYFTLRGAKVGRDELDLLAIQPGPEGQLERRHIEVSAGTAPIGYLGRHKVIVGKKTEQELREGVLHWVDHKFHAPHKEELRQRLAPGPWTFEVVVHKMYAPVEMLFLQEAGVIVHRLSEVVQSCHQPSRVRRAAGADFLDLVQLAPSTEFPTRTS